MFCLFVQETVTTAYVQDVLNTKEPDFDANWHKWYTEPGHETISFWDQESTVKITWRQTRSQKSLLARYLQSCPMIFNQTWQAHTTDGLLPIVSQRLA